MNEQQEYNEKNQEPKEDDVQGHRLVAQNEQNEEADVQGHMFDQNEQNEQNE